MLEQIGVLLITLACCAVGTGFAWCSAYISVKDSINLGSSARISALLMVTIGRLGSYGLAFMLAYEWGDIKISKTLVYLMFMSALCCTSTSIQAENYFFRRLKEKEWPTTM